MTTQRRAKAGGEEGANGDWYEGGKFIATTDHEKRAAKRVKGTGRVEVEPFRWEQPPEPDMRPLFGLMGPGVFTGKLANGEMGLIASDTTWLYYFKTPDAVEQAKVEYQGYANRFNGGERWASVNATPEPVVNTDDSSAAQAAKRRFLAEHASADQPAKPEKPRHRP